jgi:hypothetical protein
VVQSNWEGKDRPKLHRFIKIPKQIAAKYYEMPLNVIVK